MRRLRGVLTGYLTLVVLGVLVETGPATRLSGLAGDVVALMRRGLNPAVAGIPDRSSGKSGPFLNSLGDQRRSRADAAVDQPTTPDRPGAGNAPGADFSTVRG